MNHEQDYSKCWFYALIRKQKKCIYEHAFDVVILGRLQCTNIFLVHVRRKFEGRILTNEILWLDKKIAH